MKQKRQTIAGSALPVLLLTLLLFVAQAACRPSSENEGDIAVLPPDADNVEFHHVKVVNGVMHEDHPVIMYKEDFVNEDYDPSKNDTKVSHPKLFIHQKRIRHHHARPASEALKVEEQQEKIVFDVLPVTPIQYSDDDSGADNFEVGQLVQPSKEESLQKYPKKYRSRHRRQTDNPYARQSYRHNYYSAQPHAYYRPAPAPYYLPAQPQQHYQRYPVIGKKPKYRGKLPIWQTEKPFTINDRIQPDTDEENSLFHNSNPEDADFSDFDKPRPVENNSGNGAGGSNWQSPPVQEAEQAPVWGPTQGRQPWNVTPPTPEAPPPLPVYSSPSWASSPQAQPATRQDAVLYPEELNYQVGSTCHRASRVCCNLDDTGSVYDCFHRQNCEHSLSEILSACS